jgi:hypothetical protein
VADMAQERAAAAAWLALVVVGLLLFAEAEWRRSLGWQAAVGVLPLVRRQPAR